MKINSAILSIATIFLCALIYTEANAADENLINFKLVCKEQSSNCSEAVMQNTGKKILIENKPVFTLKDIASASVSSQTTKFMNHAGAMVKQEENPALLLKFKDPQKLYDVTSKNVGRILTIFINDKLIMVPRIMMPITGDTFKISGANITQQKAQSFVEEINKALKPASLKKNN